MNLRVQKELPRTNNDLEGWHNRFAVLFQQRHAHIWKFIERLQNVSALNHHSMAQIMTRAAVPPQRRVYHATSERIQLFINNYGNNNIIDLLRGTSYNLAQNTLKFSFVSCLVIAL